MHKFKLKISNQDKRGKIIDLLEKENINAITYLSFKKGAVRGNHFHKKTIQWTFMMSGKILIKSQKPNGKITRMTIKEGDLVVDEKKESHALIALKDSEIIVFTKGPRGGKEYETDTFRLEKPLIPPR